MPDGISQPPTARGTYVIAGQSPVLAVVVWAVFAALWLGVTALATTLGWEKVSQQPFMVAFLGVFWLVGLFLAGMAVHSFLQAQRFGRTTLVVDRVPVQLGSWLSGVVRGPLAVHGADIRVSVECIYRTRSHGRNSSSSNWTLWREVKVVDGTRCERAPDHVAIPFATRLPTNAEVSEQQNTGPLARLLGAGDVELVGPDRNWYVSVAASIPGVDYADRFEIPVTPAPAGAPRAAAQPPRAVPELEGQRLAERVPGRLEHRLDADVFVFPLKPLWVAWVVVPLLVAAACIAQLAVGGVPLAEQMGRDVLFWTALIAGGLGVLCLLGLMLDTRRIEVSPDAVRIRRGWLGLGFHRTIPRGEIATVVEQATRSDPPTFSVDIRTRGGTTYWAALSIPQPDQAKALATRLREVLRI